jgi:hypothetical protein
MQVSKHCLEKQLQKELQHRDWLRKNLPSQKIQKQCQKKILKLYTKLLVND